MGLVGRGAGRIADGHGADLLRGGDVALEQHRRHAQHVGHVVEAEAGVVGRQQRRGVDVERQQIADHVLILDPVQPVQRRPAGVRTGRGITIDGGLEEGHQRRARRCVGLWHALRRHRARPHLLDHLFPHGRIPRRVCDVHRVERQISGARAGVVARDAVLADQRLVRGCSHRRLHGRQRRRRRRRLRLWRGLLHRGGRLLHHQKQIVRIRRDGEAPRAGPECHRHRDTVARHDRAAGRGHAGQGGIDVPDVELQAERARILDARSRGDTRRALQLHELEQQRRVRHAYRRHPVLDVAQAQHRRHLRAGGERAQLALETETLLVERQGAVHVAHRDAEADADDVARSGRGGRGQRIELRQLDEVSVRVLHDHRSRLAGGAHRQRRAAGRDHGNPGGLQLHERRIEIANEEDQRDRARVLHAPPHRRALHVVDLHQLDAAADAGHARADEAQARLGQTMEVQVAGILVPRQRTGRRRRHEIEADQVVVEPRRAIEIVDDRADVTGAGHGAFRHRWRRRWRGLRGQQRSDRQRRGSHAHPDTKPNQGWRHGGPILCPAAGPRGTPGDANLTGFCRLFDREPLAISARRRHLVTPHPRPGR